MQMKMSGLETGDCLNMSKLRECSGRNFMVIITDTWVKKVDDNFNLKKNDSWKYKYLQP